MGKKNLAEQTELAHGLDPIQKDHGGLGIPLRQLENAP
jgi:hypothetical protein